MIRIKDIQDAMSSLVGWEQASDPKKKIDEKLTITESGLYFQGAHPMVTLDNMASIIPEDWALQYPEWNSERIYETGSKVRYDGFVWIALGTNTAETPDGAPGSPVWSSFNPLSDYLERIKRNGIAIALQTFLQIKQLSKETRTLLERRAFFDGAGRLQSTLRNRSKIVGFEIVPVRAMGITAKIERVGLQMTGGTGNVRLYLFHSSQRNPIQIFDLNFTVKHGGFQWFNLNDCHLPYIGTDSNAGGAWYLCYNQDDLPEGMEAVNVTKDWSREPCGTCNMGSLETWRQLTKYMQVSPFMVPAPETFAEYPEMWDPRDIVYTNTSNYGLNCETTVGCDLTDFIISQRAMFQTVVQLQVATVALRTLAMNPDVRVNRNQSNATRMDLLYELDGNTASPRPGGLGYELKKAYEALTLDTTGIDRVCLTCNNHGVRYRTV